MTTAAKQQVRQQYTQLFFVYVLVYIVLVIGLALGVIGGMPPRSSQLQGMHAHLVAATEFDISRNDPAYWVTGNGHWVSRWEGTSHDMWLLVSSIAVSLWLLIEYAQYHRSCGEVFHALHTSVAKTHILRLRRVFMQCMLIHMVTGILVWLVPVFWLIVVLTGLIAWQIRKLNSTKIQIRHAREITFTDETTIAALRVLNNNQLDAQARLDQARDLLIQRVTYVER